MDDYVRLDNAAIYCFSDCEVAFICGEGYCSGVAFCGLSWLASVRVDKFLGETVEAVTDDLTTGC